MDNLVAAPAGGGLPGREGDEGVRECAAMELSLTTPQALRRGCGRAPGRWWVRCELTG